MNHEAVDTSVVVVDGARDQVEKHHTICAGHGKRQDGGLATVQSECLNLRDWHSWLDVNPGQGVGIRHVEAEAAALAKLGLDLRWNDDLTIEARQDIQLARLVQVEQRRRVGDVLSHPGGRLVGRW
jgi:hypothetical protein